MDIYSLVPLNLQKQPPARMDAKAEDRYYARQFQLPRLRVLGSVAAMAGAILVLAGLYPG